MWSDLLPGFNTQILVKNVAKKKMDAVEIATVNNK
jgi:hypothetical protein